MLFMLCMVDELRREVGGLSNKSTSRDICDSLLSTKRIVF